MDVPGFKSVVSVYPRSTCSLRYKKRSGTNTETIKSSIYLGLLPLIYDIIWKPFTPRKINMETEKITQLKRKIIFHPPPFLVSTSFFQGVKTSQSSGHFSPGAQRPVFCCLLCFSGSTATSRSALYLEG